MEEVLSIVLAGGRGERLAPFTDEIPKPLVPYIGSITLINFPLSNLVNSNFRRIHVYTQHKSNALNEFVSKNWRPLVGSIDEFIDHRNAQIEGGGYAGTAHAVLENLGEINHLRPSYVIVASADHIYKMDFNQMLNEHTKQNADVSIAALPVLKKDAARLGVMETKKGGRITGFHEKVEDPPEMPDFPGYCLANMGIYIFKTSALSYIGEEDIDFGKNVFPRIVNDRHLHAYTYTTNRIPTETGEEEKLNWIDVGTVRALFDASMDQVKALPKSIDLYNKKWRIWNFLNGHTLPAKIYGITSNGRYLASPGCIVEKCSLENVILGPGSVAEDSTLTDVITHNDVVIQPGACIKGTIIDSGAQVEQGVQIGFDDEADMRRGFLPKNAAGKPYTEGVRVIPRRMAATKDGLVQIR